MYTKAKTKILSKDRIFLFCIIHFSLFDIHHSLSSTGFLMNNEDVSRCADEIINNWGSFAYAKLILIPPDSGIFEWHLNHSALPPKQNDLVDNLGCSVFLLILKIFKIWFLKLFWKYAIIYMWFNHRVSVHIACKIYRHIGFTNYKFRLSAHRNLRTIATAVGIVWRRCSMWKEFRQLVFFKH